MFWLFNKKTPEDEYTHLIRRRNNIIEELKDLHTSYQFSDDFFVGKIAGPRIRKSIWDKEDKLEKELKNIEKLLGMNFEE